MTPPTAETAARALADAHARRQRYQALPEEVRPKSLDEAYAIQAAFHRQLTGSRGRIAGYKIALTSKAMQDFVGIHHPLWGAIFAQTVRGSPATLLHADFMHLGIECEIAIRLARDLPAAKAPYDESAIAAAIDACMPAFELVEDRHADFKSLDAFSLVADNAWNAGIVLGQPIADWRARDLGNARGRLFVNDKPAGEGHGRDALGHPLKALTWLANGLAERDLELTRGMVVMTGSIVTTKFLEPDDRARFVLDGSEDVSLAIR